MQSDDSKSSASSAVTWLPSVFDALRYRNYRIMWAGAFTSATARSLQGLAQSWYIYEISGSAFYLGLTSFLEEIPIFAFSLVGGALADRYSRRLMLGLSQCIQLCCAFTLAILVLSGSRQMWPILCLSFIRGTGQSLGGPAYAAIIPNLVEPKVVPNAIALNSAHFSIARVLGPALGGLVMKTLGAAACFALNGISYFAVIASLLSLRISDKPTSTHSIFGGIAGGIRYLAQQHSLCLLLLLALCMTILGYPLLSFQAVFARDILHGGPEVLAALLSIAGLGSFTGALAAAFLGGRGIRRAAPIGVVVFGAAITAFALTRNFQLALVFLFTFGAAEIGVQAMVNSLVSATTPDEKRGRVMSVFNLAFRGGPPLGGLLIGMLVQRFGAPPVFAFIGGLLALIGCWFILVRTALPALGESRTHATVASS